VRDYHRPDRSVPLGISGPIWLLHPGLQGRAKTVQEAAIASPPSSVPRAPHPLAKSIAGLSAPRILALTAIRPSEKIRSTL